MKAVLLASVFALASAPVFAQDLSPERWPAQERAAVEKQEQQGYAPTQAAVVRGGGGMVSATVSPIAVYAGVQALKHGGTAADAAATTALTQITTQLGSVVSYAGVWTMVYYEAKTHRVYSMDAGYNSYLHETDPASIPIGDLGPLNFGRKPTQGGLQGRETLVPGFMAGLEAAQHRFGKLPFKSLFEPAIWYDEHGVLVNEHLLRFFQMRQSFLQRTPEGRAFLAQAGGATPAVGALFVQHDLAQTLSNVAEHGAAYMYTGPWAQDFVRTVQRDGGKVTAEDLARYRPIWSEPIKGEVFGHTVYVNGGPNFGGYDLLPALNIAEALGVAKMGPYWSDPETLEDLDEATAVSAGPVLSAELDAALKAKGIDTSPANQLTKDYGRQVAAVLKTLFTPPGDNGPHHSNSIVVVDKEGNVAAVTHTFNGVIWGDTGIVVGGIPIPDSANFQQSRLATLKPGDHVPHEIIDTIVMKDGKPVLATASIGSSLIPETVRTLVGILGQHQDLVTVMAKPPLMTNFQFDGPLSKRPITLVQGAYGADVLARLKHDGLTISEAPTATADGLRGTLAAVAIDPRTGERLATNQPGVMVHNLAQ